MANPPPTPNLRCSSPRMNESINNNCMHLCFLSVYVQQKSCVPYWPEKVKSEVLYGKVYVSFTSEEQTDGYTTRKFELVDEGKVRCLQCVMCWIHLHVPLDVCSV